MVLVLFIVYVCFRPNNTLSFFEDGVWDVNNVGLTAIYGEREKRRLYEGGVRVRKKCFFFLFLNLALVVRDGKRRESERKDTKWFIHA